MLLINLSIDPPMPVSLSRTRSKSLGTNRIIKNKRIGGIKTNKTSKTVHNVKNASIDYPSSHIYPKIIFATCVHSLAIQGGRYFDAAEHTGAMHDVTTGITPAHDETTQLIQSGMSDIQIEATSLINPDINSHAISISYPFPTIPFITYPFNTIPSLPFQPSDLQDLLASHQQVL